MSNPLSDMVAAMSDEERKGAIAVLDALSRPLTPREIDAHLITKCGLTRSPAFMVTKAIKGLHIIAMVGGEE